jgi:hypothetical protein
VNKVQVLFDELIKKYNLRAIIMNVKTLNDLAKAFPKMTFTELFELINKYKK